MTKSEYQELVEFIAPKFDEIGRQFKSVEKRLDKIEERLTKVEERLTKVEERLTKVEVLREEDRSQLEAVADGVANNSKIMERKFAAVDPGFQSVREEMAAGFEAVREEMADGFQTLRAEMAGGH
jgi:predicted  nucleic acid-binding Zn-ribbon protein